MPIHENFDKISQEANSFDYKFLNESKRCIACGQLVAIGQFCHHCHEMSEELRCWAK
jgi:hypothetical protein